MARIPQYGTHDGIKYNKKRTIYKWCIICGQPFQPNNNKQKSCSPECKHELDKQRNNKWNPINNPEWNPINNPKWNPIILKERYSDPEKHEAWLEYRRKWYLRLTRQQKRKYNKASNKHETCDKQEDEYKWIQSEKRRLGL